MISVANIAEHYQVNFFVEKLVAKNVTGRTPDFANKSGAPYGDVFPLSISNKQTHKKFLVSVLWKMLKFCLSEKLKSFLHHHKVVNLSLSEQLHVKRGYFNG